MFLGIPFDNFYPGFIDKALTAYLVYSFFHYAIEGYEEYMAWRIRLTGLQTDRLPLGSGFSYSDSGIAVSDIGLGTGKEASLYSLFLQAVKAYETQLDPRTICICFISFIISIIDTKDVES